MEVNLPGLLLGCALLGITVTAIGLGIISYRDHLRLRRQNTLFEGVTEIVQTIINLKGGNPCAGSAREQEG